MIGIVDYGMGNILSVYHAFEAIGAAVMICRDPDDLREAERIVLPGVGAFQDCMANLAARGFSESLECAVLAGGKPILGICLGMQAMARRSFEGGECAGLGWIEADVVRLEPGESSLRVPQVGWNDIRYRRDFPLFNGLPSSPDCYFVHSFALRCDHPGDVVATCEYGETVTAAVAKRNIFATQFHPEKSQEHGLKILENFLLWTPAC